MLFRRSTPTLFERALWDLALGMILAVIVGAAVVIGAPFSARAGETAFTAEQRADLAENAPGGEYIAASLYRYCGNDGQFWYVDSVRRLTTNSERCANWIRSR